MLPVAPTTSCYLEKMFPSTTSVYARLWTLPMVSLEHLRIGVPSPTLKVEENSSIGKKNKQPR